MESRGLVGFLRWFGELTFFVLNVFRATITPPFHFGELLRQMYEIGVRSLPLVVLAGAAIGVVLSLHSRDSLVRFGATSLVPVLIVMSVIKETGPIITALIVSGRVGAGIGAELGSMRVTEQIDAIEASAVDPVRLLAVTRVTACILMLPLLTIFANFSAIVMGWIANTVVEYISFTRYIDSGFRVVNFSDLLPSTFRTAAFGAIIGVIGCFQGMRTKGGTEGVGRSATSSVVLSSLFVIIADVLLVRIIQIIWG